jgi:hypothetical protein
MNSPECYSEEMDGLNMRYTVGATVRYAGSASAASSVPMR